MALESNLLFLRKAELIIGPKFAGSNGAIQTPNCRQFNTRFSFEGEQDETSSSNKIKVNIYNISEESRNFLEKGKLVLFLKVGYEGTGMGTLFFGDIDPEKGVHVKRQGPDIITTVEAGDSEEALTKTNIQIGLGPGATSEQVLAMAKQKLNVTSGLQTKIKGVVFQSGFSYAGSAKNLVDNLGKQSGFNWSIQNGEMFVLNPKQTSSQSAILISQDTGLIGYPIKTQKKIEFTALLNPDIRPTRMVQLESRIFKKPVRIKIEKTTFKGDTHEGDWHVKAEGEAV